MRFEAGRDGWWETKLSPHSEPSGSLTGASSVASDGSKSSPQGGDRQHDLQRPSRGIAPEEDLLVAADEGRRFTSDDATAYLRGLGLEFLPGAVWL